MLYIGKDLNTMYKNLRDSGLDGNIPVKIYAIDSYTIKKDTNKFISDLQYLSVQADFFQIEFDAPKKLKKMTDLKIEDLFQIFFDIFPENKFSLYSETFDEEDYKNIIRKIKKFYDENEYQTYLFFQCLNILLENKKEKISYINKKFTPEDFRNFIKINFDKEKIINNQKSTSILSNIIEKFYQEKFSISSLEKIYIQNFLNNKEILKARVLYEISNEKLIKILKAYNFIFKPAEKIKKEDLEEILKLKISLSIEEEKNLNSKLKIIKILILEKSYEYFFKNNYSADDAKKFLDALKEKKGQKSSENFLHYVCSNLLKKEKEKIKYNPDKIISEYIINIKNLSEEELKYFSFNNFFRNQLYYKNNFLALIKEDLLSINPTDSNTQKILKGERELGEHILEKIISSLDKKEENTNKKIKDINLYYNLLQKYKKLSLFSLENYSSEVFMRYDEIYNFFKNSDFSLNINPRGLYLYGRYVLNLTYYPEKIKEYNINENYVVKLKDGSIELMKYLGECDNKLCFFKEGNLQIFLKEEVEIHQIKSLVFAEDTKKEIKTLF